MVNPEMNGPGMAVATLASGYDLRLVALSVIIVIVGAYVGLTLSERVAKHRGKSRYLWLAGGAFLFGYTSWAMHVTGMVAFRMPVDVSYDIPSVALSLLVAVVSAGATLFTVTRPRSTWRLSLAGAVMMGGGIGSMHYIGMLGMRMPADIIWNVRVVALSVVVAVVFSFAALRLSAHLRAASSTHFGWHRVSAAIVTGVATSGMHYTGMAAATYTPAPAVPASGLLLSAGALGGTAVASITLLVSGIAILLAILDRRFAAKDTALALSQRRLSMVIANAPVVLFAFDAAGIITIAEGRDLAAMGHPAESMIGRSFFTVYEDAPALTEQARLALLGNEHTALSTLGGIVLETHWTPVFHFGAVGGVVAVATDITERWRADIALQHLALHDTLTGLPNRAYLQERLAEELQAAVRTGIPVALALIDLDHFKEINDSLGHAVGDDVLQHVAARLRSDLREGDLVARLGGDEFVLLLPNTSDTEAVTVARRIVDSLAPPFVTNGRTLDVTGSIGLAVSPQHGDDPTTLLRKADIAMYAAKRSRGGCVLYDPALDQRERRLRAATDDEAFVLVYQPIYSLNGTLTGCEALIRWPQPDGTVVPPNDFIPLAEECGMIVPIGAWVLRTACRQNAVWNRTHPNHQMSVNVSAKQLADPHFFQTVQSALLESGLAPELLELELTETVVGTNVEGDAAVLRRLRDLGVRIAVDDFGTGYNSLATLRSFVVDTLKLDRCFVTDIADSPVDRAIASAVITAAHALGACVVAEGIETAEQLATLKALSIDFGQGYLFSRPIAPEAFAHLLHADRVPTAA
jgi:diguanylate cyclase (GGDEF)-like protein